MPFIAGFVGWITNVIALEMTFRPIDFFGIEIFRIKDQVRSIPLIVVWPLP